MKNKPVLLYALLVTVSIFGCKQNEEPCVDVGLSYGMGIFLIDENTGHPLVAPYQAPLAAGYAKYHPDSLSIYELDDFGNLFKKSRDEFGFVDDDAPTSTYGFTIILDYDCGPSQDTIPNRTYLFDLGGTEVDTVYVQCLDKTRDCGSVHQFYYNGKLVSITNTDTTSFTLLAIEK